MFDSTGATHAVFAAPRGRRPTIGACLASAVGEVFTMNCAVAGCAERNAVGRVKAQIGMARPRFDVMGVDHAHGPALLAGILVTREHASPPFCEARAETRAASLKGTTILPSVGSVANVRFARTRSRTKALMEAFGSRERCIADRASLDLGWITPRPTSLGAEFGGVGSIAFNRIGLATELTE